ncbi:amino acid/amide ABC transporter ATP-binding protein 1, HAAT family [Tistlia consotensis]|uniref:Amino acid/amide ABC transporter ATP-binding protein 1, HAAT family n=1 Tax=Tistlia consotensis USBA 355 TaxID=560819 RepID=A0A1Y6B462_9PROT|nr:ABC transporter ATP-binding protein [Tistlia consotensis]SME90978.1 amino acid/amide ABC transporter ATP-binding protein 1, HAAT family [Tistlia consotensis USBA 355]SNR27041.1 amino acid/amide ABC transporter ATP-binding protein 1, HAAT family [Tistlia consotensis]
MTATAGRPILEAEGVARQFGRFVALGGVDLALEAGEKRALIGPNGAGKSTFINVVGGQLAASAGTIRLDGRDVTGLQPHQLARSGLGRTFQISRTYRQMSVRENLVAAYLVARGHGYSLSRGRLRALAAEAEALLERVGIAGLAERPADDISHGDRKRLEFAMVLAGEPRLLLLDEPTAGMGLKERHELMDLVAEEASGRGLTLLFVEHDIDVVFRIADRITVMARGQVFAEGTADEIAADREVQRIYLGEGH